jgi:hypothetical protein
MLYDMGTEDGKYDMRLSWLSTLLIQVIPYCGVRVACVSVLT